MAARTQAWLERREEELDVWEASLVDKQRELDTVVRQFREEMATSLAQLASQRRDLQSFAQSLATREEQLSRAEESLLAREDRLMADASRLAALIVNDSDDGDATLTPTRQRHNNIPSERSGDRPVTSAGRPSSHEHSGHRQHQHVDPTLSATEEVTTIDLATLVVRGSVVMTSDGHILSPLESAEVLVQCGAFEASEIEALMRQGYSATAILAEQLGTDDGARPGTPDRPRTRAVGAPADRSSGGQRVAQHHHGFDDSEDEGAYEEDNVVEGMEGVEEGEYDDGEFEYIEEEEEEEEEEEHNISLK